DLWLVQAFEGSCAGKCGSWAEDCWCNDQCEERGNCCDDYKEQCQQQCEKCGKYTCDEWIAWDPAKNSCASLKKDWLCQCKGCHCGADFDANLQLFSPKDYPDAQCLDGSMAGVYIRKGSYKQTLIFLEGGGWCYDPSCQPQASATLQDCQKRSYGRLGSSSTWAQTMPERYLRGMLSANAEENPIFHNWTLVYVPYCDGASFTGDQIVRYEGKDLHFKGSKILEALLDTLRWTETKQLVVSGGSAGALAVLMHIDEIAEKVQRPREARDREGFRAGRGAGPAWHGTWEGELLGWPKWGDGTYGGRIWEDATFRK
ncbi:Pectin acetylesterase 5, partial [Durusdinium trenchii]